MSIVCSTSHLFHYLFNERSEVLDSILKDGLRPLSDFPESERWKQIKAYKADFFEAIYEGFAKPIIQKPYENSGIFLTPIDFHKLPNTFLYDKTRLAIPMERINAEYSAISYEYKGQRILQAFDKKNLEDVAELWQEDLVREWFGKDSSRVFLYVPQMVTYQRIAVSEADVQKPA
jgi:hypothetical protein